MNAVASAVACPPAASKKIRRRPENKVNLNNDFTLKKDFLSVFSLTII